MQKPRPGSLLTYDADTERTGIVLDAAPGPACFWVHREDGTFDRVRVAISGKREGRTDWQGRFTVSGQPLTATESVAA